MSVAKSWSEKELKGVISSLDLLFGTVTSKLKLCLFKKLGIWPMISKIWFEPARISDASPDGWENLSCSIKIQNWMNNLTSISSSRRQSVVFFSLAVSLSLRYESVETSYKIIFSFLVDDKRWEKNIFLFSFSSGTLSQYWRMFSTIDSAILRGISSREMN